MARPSRGGAGRVASDEQRPEVLPEAIEAEVARDQRASRRAHPGSQIGIAQQKLQAAGQRLGVAMVNQETRRSVGPDLGRSTMIAADDRLSERHRFQKDDAE